MINNRDNFVQNLKASMHENPSKFWSFVKTSTHYRSNANFLRNGNEFIINKKNKDGHLNKFFHSVFSSGSNRLPYCPGASCIKV